MMDNWNFLQQGVNTETSTKRESENVRIVQQFWHICSRVFNYVSIYIYI
jgi:hypothetical protein